MVRGGVELRDAIAAGGIIEANLAHHDFGAFSSTFELSGMPSRYTFHAWRMSNRTISSPRQRFAHGFLARRAIDVCSQSFP